MAPKVLCALSTIDFQCFHTRQEQRPSTAVPYAEPILKAQQIENPEKVRFESSLLTMTNTKRAGV